MNTALHLDQQRHKLPYARNNPPTLQALFGTTAIRSLWVADMEFQVAQPIQEALVNRIQSAGFPYEYKPESFFAAQKAWYQQHYGLDLQREQVLYSPAITTSMAILLDLCTEAGDSVLTQPPVFMEFRDVIRKTGRRIQKNPLQIQDGRYTIDFADLENKAKAPETKVLIICNPHNPVGRVWTREELAQVVAICKAQDLLLIADEIHKDIVLFGHRFTSVLEFSDEYDKIAVCTSEAKTFNLPGIADSMLIIPDETLRQTASAVLKKYNLGRTNGLARVALEAAYTEGAPWVAALVAQIEANVRAVAAALADTPIGMIHPEGTYQIWLDFRQVFADTKEMFRYLTDKTGVGLNAGHWFGREGAGFMRMNIATTTEQLLEATEKIKRAVAEKMA